MQSELNEEEQQYRAAPIAHTPLGVVGTAGVEAVSNVVPGAVDGVKSGGKAGLVMVGLTALVVTALVVGTGGLGAAAVYAYIAAGAGAASIGTATASTIFAGLIPTVLGVTAVASAVVGTVSAVAGGVGGAATGAVTGVIGRVTAAIPGGVKRAWEENTAAHQLEKEALAARRQGFLDAKHKFMEAGFMPPEGVWTGAPVLPSVQTAHVHQADAPAAAPHAPVTHQVVHREPNGHVVTTTSITGGHPQAHQEILQAAHAHTPPAAPEAAPILNVNHAHAAPVTVNVPVTNELHPHVSTNVNPVIHNPVTSHVAPAPVTNEMNHTAPSTVETKVNPAPVITHVAPNTHVTPVQEIINKRKQEENHTSTVQQENKLNAILQNGPQNNANAILKRSAQGPVISPENVAQREAAAKSAQMGVGAGG